MNKISIVIPVFNAERFLEHCIESVIRQTYQEWEILLIDDGSTDNSGDICDRYTAKDERIFSFHKRNGGLCSARNYGMERCTGNYIMFLDSDDYLTSYTALHTLISYSEKLNLDVVRFEYTAVDEDSILLYNKPIQKKEKVTGRLINNYEMVETAVSGEWFSCLFFVKCSQILSERFNVKQQFQEDIEFFARFFSKQSLRCGYLPERFYAYRKRRNSMTSTAKISNLEGSFSLCDKFANLAISIRCKKLRRLYWYYSVMMYYWTLNTITEDIYYSYRKQIIADLGLKALHNRILSRLDKCGFIGVYYFFIIPSPYIASYLLRIKNIFAIKLYRLFDK